MKIFGIEIGKRKVEAEKAAPPAGFSATSMAAAMTEIKDFGLKLTAFDYAKDSATLTTIAKYNPWIASSIRAITRNSIQPVIKVWNPKTKEDVNREDLLELLRNPHPDFTEARFRKYMTFYYNYCGIAFALKIRMGNKVIALQPLPSDRVRKNPTLLAKGIVAWQLVYGSVPVDLPTEDLIIWSDDEFIDDYYTGGSKLSHLLFAAANKNNADRFNKATIENGGEVKGVLYSDQRLSKEDVKIYQDQIKERHGGPDKAGKNMILGNGLKYERTGQTIAEMGFDRLQQVSREEVLAVFKVPPVELGLTDSVNYANAKEQRKLFWETTMIPTMDSFASAMTRGLLKDEYKFDLEYYFDYSAIPALQTDLNTKLQSANLMQILGYPNATITEYLDLPELEEEKPIEDEQPPKEEPAQKHIVIPNHVKSLYREGVKDLFGRSHAYVEAQFRRNLEKYFLGWRNDVLDQIKSQFGIKDEINQKDRLLEYVGKRTELADKDLKKIGSVMFARINDEIVKKLIARYGLKWHDVAANIITTNNHLENFVMVNKTVDDELRARLEAAYLEGIQNNYSTGELAESFINTTKKVYKMADNRAILIARTETTSMANDMMLGQYKENEVEAREWLTAQDGDVRTIGDGAQFDHSLMDGKTAKIGEMFSVPSLSGVPEAMRYPGDMVFGSAGNVCNCFLPDTICEGNFVKALKAEYSGPVREIITRRGYRLTTTINHPILTDKGWVPSGELYKGSNLIAYSSDVRDGFLSNPDHQNNPALIKNIFDTFLANGGSSRVVIETLDFYGDGNFINNRQVDVVSINRELPKSIDAVIRSKASKNLKLIESGALLGLISVNRPLDSSASHIMSATPFDPRSFDLTLDKSGLLFDFGPFQSLGFGSASDWYTGLGQASKQDVAIVPTFVRQLLETASGQIAFDEIVEIRDFNFSGHVYDLQSIDDYILSNGIVSSNCRCTTMPV